MKLSRYLLTICLSSLVLSQALTQPLPMVQPKEVGICAKRLALLEPMIKKAIADKDFPGAAILVARQGKIV